MINTIQEIIKYFPYAILAGIIIAPACALLGVFTILKRVVFIGITLSEVAACGIAFAMVYNLHPFVGAAVFTISAVTLLSYPFESNRIPRDAILGVIFVCASSLGILLVSGSGFGLHEVKRLLYGDLILTSIADIHIILIILIPALIFILLFMRPTLNTFVDREFAKILNIRVVLWEFLYFFVLGLVVSAASKVAGALLIFCYLVVIPGAALIFTRKFNQVILIAVIGALVPTFIGIYISYAYNLPANQTIAVIATGLFVIIALLKGAQRIFIK